MKKSVAFAIIGLFLASVVASCASSRGGHCDAYSQAKAPVEQNDLAAN